MKLKTLKAKIFLIKTNISTERLIILQTLIKSITLFQLNAQINKLYILNAIKINKS